MPEGREFVGLYLGELYWSPAYRYHNDPHMGEFGWRTVSHESGPECPRPILPLSEKYLSEHGTFDCSVDDTIAISVPAEQLVYGMNLDWQGDEGSFYDAAGRLAAQDPSVRAPGPSALLVRRNTFLTYLEEHEYSVLWTVLGERNVVSGNFGRGAWQGSTVISGACRLSGSDISGSLSAVSIPQTAVESVIRRST